MDSPKDGDRVRFVRCTKSEYEQIQNKDPSTVYFIVPEREENTDEED